MTLQEAKDQAAREFVLDEFEDLLHEHPPTMKKVFHAIVNRALEIYAEDRYEEGYSAGVNVMSTQG